MNKINAITIINNSNLNNRNTIYSGITSTVKSIPAYWFEPNYDKFKHKFYLILDNHFDKIIYYFIIDGKNIENPYNLFYQREDKGVFSIKIKYNDYTFTDYAGPSNFSFLPYLENKFTY